MCLPGGARGSRVPLSTSAHMAVSSTVYLTGKTSFSVTMSLAKVKKGNQNCLQNMFQKNSESAFLCGSKGNMCVPGAVVFACVKRTVPSTLLLAFGGLDFCVFHSYCRLDFRCTNLPIIYRNPALGGRASWRLKNLVFFSF